MAKKKKADTKKKSAGDSDSSNKRSAFEELAEKYSGVAEYQDVSERLINPKDGSIVRGATNDLVAVVNDEMNKIGLKDEHKQPHIELIREGGGEEVFKRFLGLGQKKALDEFNNYAKSNLKDIIYSTDDEILMEIFLPHALKKKTGVAEYDNLGKLVKDVNERIDNLKKYEKNPENAKELASKVAEELKTDYKKSYDDKDLLDVLNAMANGVAMIKYQIDTQKKQKELVEKLDGKLKDYIYKALGEDVIGIYAQLYEDMRQRAKQGYSQVA